METKSGRKVEDTAIGGKTKSLSIRPIQSVLAMPTLVSLFVEQESGT